LNLEREPSFSSTEIQETDEIHRHEAISIFGETRPVGVGFSSSHLADESGTFLVVQRLTLDEQSLTPNSTESIEVPTGIVRRKRVGATSTIAIL
jgi:hypothetical protein